eukprot:3638574-Rhodomonas_salina.1
MDWNARSTDFGTFGRTKSSDLERIPKHALLARDQAGSQHGMIFQDASKGLAKARDMSIDVQADDDMSSMVSPRNNLETPARDTAEDDAGDFLQRAACEQIAPTRPIIRHLESPLLRQLESMHVPPLEPGRGDLIPETSSKKLVSGKGQIKVEDGQQLLLKNGQAMKMRCRLRPGPRARQLESEAGSAVVVVACSRGVFCNLFCAS